MAMPAASDDKDAVQPVAEAATETVSEATADEQAAEAPSQPVEPIEPAEPIESVADEAQPLQVQPLPLPVEAAPQPEPTATQPALVEEAQSVAAAPVESVAEPVAEPARILPDNLRENLAAAGLTLAVTDPAKLRAAQEAAARIVPAPRVLRERKPLPPVSNEPLIQVETRH